MTDLLSILGRGDARSYRVTEAIDALLAECCDRESPHAFEERAATGIDGVARTIKVFPAAWTRRLERAAEAGAFERLPVPEIVQRILTTEEPATP